MTVLDMNNPEDEATLRALMMRAHEDGIKLRAYVDTKHAPRKMTEEPPQPRRKSDGARSRQDRALKAFA